MNPPPSAETPSAKNTSALGVTAHRSLELGGLNAAVGAALLMLGFAAAIVLDPWAFGLAQGAVHSPFSAEHILALRHVQGVLVAMGFLQLAVGQLLAAALFPAKIQKQTACLTACGALCYAGGYLVATVPPDARIGELVWRTALNFAPAGSLLNLIGFGWLALGAFRSRWREDNVQARLAYPLVHYQMKLILPVVCFGMLLDFISAISWWRPDWVSLEYLGPPDGLRLRMLRLARVAAIALSVVMLLYEGLASLASPGKGVTLGRLALLGGAVGMPTILAAACFTFTALKYLLPVPAILVVTGVVIGVRLAFQHGKSLERWGWSLLALSTSVGLLMGLYAFDGPLRTPRFLGDYLALHRQLSLMTHSYVTVLGLLAIFLSRRLAIHPLPAWSRQIFPGLFMLGCAGMIAALLLRMFVEYWDWILRLGPMVVLLSAVLIWIGGHSRE